ncbi:MAG TPA: caspase family protein [Pyrinomonadaceae bacterium]|nr:caspase family protein [Pyrinomonadaceae bacterium]
MGIDKYDNLRPLTGCVDDAYAMREALETHENGDANYSCFLLTSRGASPITRKLLRRKWSELFDNYEGDILFYFSGHGHPTDVGGFIVTQDAEPGDPGLSMNDLLTLANNSRAKSVVMILDCCFAGMLGNPGVLQGGRRVESVALLREGLTILAASRPEQTAEIAYGRSVFTSLLLAALHGGAADVRGNVSVASVYAYADQALGEWDQRAVYKTHAYNLPPLRRCAPSVPDSILRWLPKTFPNVNDWFKMDPSYEHTDPSAIPEHVEIFNKFKLLRNARLLTTEEGKDLYYIALESKTISLTPLGQFYWHLAKEKNLR